MRIFEIKKTRSKKLFYLFGKKIFSLRIEKKVHDSVLYDRLLSLEEAQNKATKLNVQMCRMMYLYSIEKQRLEHYEYSVYSQNGEDGIISEILDRINNNCKTFVEFGVGDGTENNTVYLLTQGWKGLWIEGVKEFYNKIHERFGEYISNGNLIVENMFVTPDNINEIISKQFVGNIGVLSIDIDGYDYDVWNAIDCISPYVVVLEYNSTYPPPVRWHLSYQRNYTWNKDNFFGMTLSAANELSKKKGYILVGTDLHGVNAFFVREDIFNKYRNKFDYCLDEDQLYNSPKFGLLPYDRGHKNSMRYQLLRDE